MDFTAKIFLNKKQAEHFDKYGVYADVNSKIAEWMQEYSDEVIKGYEDILFLAFRYALGRSTYVVDDVVEAIV